MQPHTASLNVGGIGQAHERLSGSPINWPEPDGIDAAGIQLLISAVRSGHAIPERILLADDVKQQATRLCIEWPPQLPAKPVPEAAP